MFSLSISSFVSKLFCDEFFGALIILLAILLPIGSPVSSAVFRMTLFEEVLNASVADCLPRSRSSLLYLLLTFLLIFLPVFLSIFLAF